MEELKTISEIKKSLSTGKISSVELTKHYLEKIEQDNKRDDAINGMLLLLKDYAIDIAKKADKQLKNGKEGLLLGVPLAIKDNINIEGIDTTCASKILTGYKATFNATVIDKLNDAGAVYLGKANLDEFAMGSSTETSYYGVCRNPVDRKKIPGGSSGGSVALVAADFAPGALGSDTGGSIRQPASLCGVVGLKPTYGRVSRYGLVAYASSLDQIGPIGRCVEDCAYLLQAISGYDAKDTTSINKDVPDYLTGLKKDIKGKKIGIPKELFVSGLSEDVEKSVKKSIEKLEELGCEIVEISMPHSKYGIPAYYLIATAEASSNLSRFDGIRYGYRAENPENLLDVFLKSRGEGFGAEVKRRILLGTYALSAGYYDAYYKKAQIVRTIIKNDYLKAFEKCDVIVSPTSPTTAVNIGDKINDPIQMYLMDIFTVNINLSGVPALSLPCGKDKNNLPIGVQLIGKYFEEDKLLNIAYNLEQTL